MHRGGAQNLRNWIFAGCALLSASAAFGAAPSEPYAKVGDWVIDGDDQQRCAMSRLFESTATDPMEALVVVYSVKQGLVLNWASKKPKFLPPRDSLALDLSFMRGKSWNETWGSQNFEYKKSGDTHQFHLVFADRNNVERMLTDLSSSKIVSLSLGPILMMSLPLDAADAVRKLRECAAQGRPAL
jgi:hypothetical protein